MLISNLYEESIHLKKTLQDAENITKKSYDLYKAVTALKEERTPFPFEEFGKQALKIAGEVHEIKKDNQRIFAGLSKLISDESLADYMDIHELVDIIVRTNQTSTFGIAVMEYEQKKKPDTFSCRKKGSVSGFFFWYV